MQCDSIRLLCSEVQCKNKIKQPWNKYLFTKYTTKHIYTWHKNTIIKYLLSHFYYSIWYLIFVFFLKSFVKHFIDTCGNRENKIWQVSHIINMLSKIAKYHDLFSDITKTKLEFLIYVSWSMTKLYI